MRIKIKAMIILVTILLYTSITAIVIPVKAGTIWHVYPGPGTPIQTVITGAAPGDTIIVHAGIYNEVVNVGKLLTLRGEDGAIIKPDDTTALLDGGVRRVAIYVTADSVTIRGFEIDGTAGHVHYGIYVFNAMNVVITRNTIHDIINEIAGPVWDVAGVGILFFGWGQGIDGATIERNTIYNTGRMGIFVGGMKGSGGDWWKWLLSNNNVIEGNNVYKTWQGPTNDGGGAVQINGAKNCAIQDNVIHHTTLGWFYVGIYLCGSASGNSIVHNNVHHNYYGLVVWIGPPFIVWGSESPTTPTLVANNIHNNAVLDVWIL